MKHATLDQILSYATGSSSGDTELTGHLATCERCHGIFMGIREVGRTTGASFERQDTQQGCPEDWEIAALIKGELDRQNDVRQHISGCEPCMDRAASYYKAELAEVPAALKAPTSWKKKAVERLAGGPTQVSVPLTERLSDAVRRVSEWLTPVPAYALATAAIALLIWVALPPGTKVLVIPSSEQIAFRKDSGERPSFGFAGSEKVEKYSGMTVAKKRGNLVFTWKAVPGATGYSVSITNKESGGAVVSGSESAKPELALPVDRFREGELYVWTISGKTGEEERFEYTGEFMLAK